MANIDTYPTEASLQDADSVLGIDASAATGSKTKRFLLSALRTFFGDQRVPVPETAHGFSVGDLVYRSAGGWAQADATDLASAMYTGIVAAVPDVDNFVLQMIGFVTGLSGLTDGTWYYLQDDGSLDTTPGTTWCPVLMAVGTTTGFLFPSRPAPGLGSTSNDMVLGFTGPISASVLDWILVGRACFIDNTAPGEAFARTLPSADWTADIQKNGTGVGTVTISSAGVVTWSIASDISLAAGDRIELVAPDPADGTIEDVQVAFRALVT